MSFTVVGAAVLSAAATVVVGVVGALVRVLFLGYPPPTLPAGATLNAKEQAFVAACADALFPAGGPIPLSGTEAGVLGYMDAYVRRLPPGSRALIRLLFLFTEHAPWILGPRRARFTRLSADDRIRALDAMAKSPVYFLRVAFLSLRTMLSIGYLANESVAGRIGMVPRKAPFERRASKLPSIPPPARPEVA